MDVFTIREFIKRYVNTYLILKDAKTSKLKSCFLRDAVVEEDSSFFVFEGFNLEVSKVLVHEVPFRKCFNATGGVCIYSRIPQRQFKKGFCNENTHLLNGMSLILKTVDKNVADTLIRDTLRPDGDLIQMMVDTPYTNSVRLAAVASQSNRVQTCVSEVYWVSRTFVDDEFILFRYEVPVGSYNLVTDEITPITAVYQQELIDLVNRLNLQTKVN